MHEGIGIDLGYAKIAVSSGDGVCIRTENSLVALRREDGSFLGIGESADRYVANAGGEVVLRRMFKEGIVAPEFTRAAIAQVLSRFVPKGGIRRVFLSIPCSFGDVEEGALAEMAVQAGADEVYLVYSPLAALAGNDIELVRSAMIVDIGAVRTNVLTVCHGRIFYKKTFSVGGQSFDRAIADYLLKKHKVKISLETAEEIKVRIGTVWVANEKKCLDVRGRDATNGDYCTVRISSEEMFAALEEPMATLIEGICHAITKIPTDCVQEVFDTGILLSGGGCLLDGIDKMISGVTGVDTGRLTDPEHTVARGLATLLNTLDSPQNAGTLNISRYIMKAAATPQRG